MIVNGVLLKTYSLLLNKICSSKEENGFTLVEIIVVLMIFGIISSIAIPQIASVTNKAKQREASMIVASILKASQAHQAEYRSIPLDMGDISEYAKFQKCIANNVETQGGSACKTDVPVAVLDTDRQFYSSSGHYNIEIQTSDNPLVFQVKANPNGRTFSTTGSAVVGCYKPEMGISYLKEFSSKTNETGAMPYINCEMESQTILPPNESIAFGPDSGLSCREAKSLPAGITNGYVYLSGRARRSVPIVPVDITIGDKSWRIEGVTAAIDNAYNDNRWLGTFASEAASVINNSEGEFSAEIDPNDPGSIKIYGPSGNVQNDIEMRIDSSERSRLSRGTYPYAYPSLGNWNDNWDNNKQAYVMPDQNDNETTSVCDGR